MLEETHDVESPSGFKLSCLIIWEFLQMRGPSWGCLYDISPYCLGSIARAEEDPNSVSGVGHKARLDLPCDPTVDSMKPLVWALGGDCLVTVS